METELTIPNQDELNTEIIRTTAIVTASFALVAATVAFGSYYGGRFVANKVMDWKEKREAKKASPTQ